MVCGETIKIVLPDPLGLGLGTRSRELSNLSKRLCVEEASSMKIFTNHVDKFFLLDFGKRLRFGLQHLYWVTIEFTFAENCREFEEEENFTTN